MSTPQEVAVIVGVGPGLGASLAHACHAAGMKVALLARSADTSGPLAAGLKGARAYACDATDYGNVDSTFAQIDEDLGAPTLCVYNAGAFEPGSILDISPIDFERCWRVGCLGAFYVGQQAARRMVKAGRGTILFTGATASLRGSARFANLAVGKFGQRALGQSMARELGPHNVHVAHVIIDGQILSPRYRHLLDDRGPDSLLDPDAIAAQYLNLHAQPRSAWTQELDLRPWVEKF
ncbi:MAG: SDR family NAD(P)-dependent oxidoreductase [Alphaproteobacteria bacterium]|nr:SDR family NAD(P)-dependent oxidoreductase [Alphaproteobacteria bacterium]